jgi:hypothetical protein
VIKAKGYADLDALVEPWTGSDEFAAIKAAIDVRASAPPFLLPADESTPPPPSMLLSEGEGATMTMATTGVGILTLRSFTTLRCSPQTSNWL